MAKFDHGGGCACGLYKECCCKPCDSYHSLVLSGKCQNCGHLKEMHINVVPIKPPRIEARTHHKGYPAPLTKFTPEPHSFPFPKYTNRIPTEYRLVPVTLLKAIEKKLTEKQRSNRTRPKNNK